MTRVHAFSKQCTAFAVTILLSLVTGIAANRPRTPRVAEEIGTVRNLYDGTLYPDIQVRTLRNAAALFPTRTIKRGTSVYPLRRADATLKGVRFMSAGRQYDLADYLSLNRVAGLLILKNGRIALENYELGNNGTTRWLSGSIAKSITSTLIGAALKEGRIKSLNDPVTAYLPRLSESAYEGVTIRNLLQMTSGVKWDETYTNAASDRRQMLEAQISGRPGSILELMTNLPRANAPGTVWHYNTGETQIAGELIRAAVKIPVAQYLSEKIWSKFGMESDATWWLDSPNGQEIGGSGLNATLRDYGRFGLFVLSGGMAAGEAILPEGWMAEAGSSKTVGGKRVGYGYMWWIPGASPNSSEEISRDPVHEGSFVAHGIFGQSMYLNPRENLVIVVLSAQSKPTGADVIRDEDLYAAVARALH